MVTGLYPTFLHTVHKLQGANCTFLPLYTCRFTMYNRTHYFQIPKDPIGTVRGSAATLPGLQHAHCGCLGPQVMLHTHPAANCKHIYHTSLTMPLPHAGLVCSWFGFTDACTMRQQGGPMTLKIALSVSACLRRWLTPNRRLHTATCFWLWRAATGTSRGAASTLDQTTQPQTHSKRPRLCRYGALNDAVTHS